MKLLETYHKILSEDITSGSVIVYHRTGKDGSPIKGIAADGYRVGSGAMYGIGVYTCYKLESQLKPHMEMYGDIIIESKILSMDKFLIFDYDVAKKIYGNVNYTLDKQLRIILGNKWKKYSNDSNLKNLIEKIPVVKYTAEVAHSFTSKYLEIINQLRGIVFTGSNDGHVLATYDRTNIEPLRYSINRGKTWKNIIDKNIYSRIKKYDKENKLIKLQHLLNKIDLGVKITNDDIETIKNNQDYMLKYLYPTTEIISYLEPSHELDKYIENFWKEEKNLYNEDYESFKILLNKLINKDKIIDKLFNYTPNIYLIKYLKPSTRLDKYIIDFIDTNTSYLFSYYDDDIKLLIDKSIDKDLIIKKIIEVKNHKLTRSNIEILIELSSKKDEIIDKIMNIKDIKLTSEVYEFLKNNYSNHKKFEKFNHTIIYNYEEMLARAKNDMIDYIINLKKDRLTDEEVYKTLYLYREEEKEIERIIIKLINNGISKDTINNAIEKLNKIQKDENKIQLISELNEQITRMKSLIRII